MAFLRRKKSGGHFNKKATLSLMRQDKTSAMIFLISSAVFSFCIPLVYSFTRTLGHDWNNLNGDALFVRSCLFFYHVLPLHNPWVLGGIDFTGHPALNLYSPFVLLDIFFQPHWANLIYLVIFAALGGAGMVRLLLALEVSRPSAYLGSFLFINSSYFGLHFTEGHITYAALQLLPWIPYFLIRCDDERAQFGLAFLLSFFIFERGSYAFLMGLPLIASLVFFQPLSHFSKKVPARLIPLFGLMFVLLASIKLIPFYLTTDRTMSLARDLPSLPPNVVLKAFFDPVQHLLKTPYGPLPWGFHEYGCYLGLLSLTLVAATFLRKSFRQENQRFMLGFLFWLWVGTGWGFPWNPWTLFLRFHPLNYIHIHSRLFILMYIFFIVLVAKSVDLFRERKGVVVLFVVLGLEALFVKNYPFWHAFHHLSKPPMANRYITKTKITETLSDGPVPDIYFEPDTAYARITNLTYPSHVRSSDDPDYRGEIYFLYGTGQARVDEIIPGRVKLDLHTDGPAVIQLNLNNMAGWTVRRGNAVTLSDPSGRLTIGTWGQGGPIELRYAPPYRWIVFSMFLAGWGLFIFLIFRCFGKS